MIYSAFLVGLLGSVHCLGMCGPIALALPVKNGSPWQKVWGRLVYNSGRIFTYSLIGFFIGWLGWGLAFSVSQQNLSIGMGALLLLVLFTPARFTRQLNPLSPIARFTSGIKQRFSTLFRQRSNQALLLMGLLNGLLPCGLVYVALAGAVAMGSGGGGMAYMALFGLGTLPAMLATSLAGQWLSLSRRAILSKAAPIFTFVLACLLIVRGLNLGIPGWSPRFESASSGTAQHTVRVDCCHKH
jgi:sulfite exporter TauE/SafE